jgi:hypothetical protein
VNRTRASLRREREQLARIFSAIIVAASPASAILVACDSVSDPVSQVDAASSVVTVDASDSAADANDGLACAITASYFDSGIYFDAEGGGVDVGCIYDLPCGLPPTLMPVGCGVYFADAIDSSLPDAHAYAGCTIAEGSGCTSGAFTPTAAGGLGIICTDCLAGGGRRPRGLRSPKRVAAKTPSGAYFATMAHEEAASVHAFHRMKQELLRFGAPERLVRAASRATREESSHAKMMKRLATAFGGVASPALMKKESRRSLEAMAIENAVEGCVNETFGALLMTWQSANTSSKDLRTAFAKIARDETGHAVLSREVAAWAETQLDAQANARVKRARSRAVAKLERSSKRLENKGFEQIVGWPTRTQRSELIQKMVTSLALA